MKTAKDLKVGDTVVMFINGFPRLCKVTETKFCDHYEEPYYYIILDDDFVMAVVQPDADYLEDIYGDFDIIYFDIDDALKALYNRQQDINYAIDSIYRIKRLENV